MKLDHFMTLSLSYANTVLWCSRCKIHPFVASPFHHISQRPRSLHFQLFVRACFLVLSISGLSISLQHLHSSQKSNWQIAGNKYPAQLCIYCLLNICGRCMFRSDCNIFHYLKGRPYSLHLTLLKGTVRANLKGLRVILFDGPWTDAWSLFAILGEYECKAGLPCKRISAKLVSLVWG